jgi:hypothetical protein
MGYKIEIKKKKRTEKRESHTIEELDEFGHSSGPNETWISHRCEDRTETMKG